MKLTQTDRLILLSLTVAASPVTFADLVRSTASSPLTLARKLPLLRKAGLLAEIPTADEKLYALPSSSLIPATTPANT